MFQYQTGSYRHPYHHDYYYDRYRHYYPYRDLLLYDLIRDRDYYRERYYDKLYDVDDCNPYYNNLWCRRR